MGPTASDAKIRIRLPIALVTAMIAVVLGATEAAAHSYRHGHVQIGHVWAPPADGDGAAVYMPLIARGAPDRLIAASSPAAEHVSFRKEVNGNIEEFDEISLEADRPLGLAEWREHLWLEDLTVPLREGDRVPITLHFAEAGEITVEIHVETTPGH